MSYELRHIPEMFRKLDVVKYPYYANNACPYCTQLGCDSARAKYGKRLGHWMWTLQYTKLALQAVIGPRALLKRLDDLLHGLDYSKIDDVEVDGIDGRDAPDFCDAFIASATYKGRKMTEAELDRLNEDRDFVYEQVEKHLY